MWLATQTTVMNIICSVRHLFWRYCIVLDTLPSLATYFTGSHRNSLCLWLVVCLSFSKIYKSTKCNDMRQTGYCPRGPFCAFAHVESKWKFYANKAQYNNTGESQIYNCSFFFFFSALRIVYYYEYILVILNINNNHKECLCY